MRNPFVTELSAIDPDRRVAGQVEALAGAMPIRLSKEL
jgi:hypothetical protein